MILCEQAGLFFFMRYNLRWKSGYNFRSRFHHHLLGGCYCQRWPSGHGWPLEHWLNYNRGNGYQQLNDNWMKRNSTLQDTYSACINDSLFSSPELTLRKTLDSSFTHSRHLVKTITGICPWHLLSCWERTHLFIFIVTFLVNNFVSEVQHLSSALWVETSMWDK